MLKFKKFFWKNIRNKWPLNYNTEYRPTLRGDGATWPWVGFSGAARNWGWGHHCPRRGGARGGNKGGTDWPAHRRGFPATPTRWVELWHWNLAMKMLRKEILYYLLVQSIAYICIAELDEILSSIFQLMDFFNWTFYISLLGKCYIQKFILY